MPDLPIGVGTGIVRIRLRHSVAVNGVQLIQPVVGRVYFTPTAEFLRDATNDVLYPVHAYSAYLDPNGDGQVELVATDNPSLEPVDYTYEVSFDLEQVHLDSFHIDVPDGSDRQLADISPVPAANGIWYVQGPPGPPGVPGVGGSVMVQEDNTTVLTAASLLDFRGEGVLVTLGDAGEAIITVSAVAGGTSSYTHYQVSASTTWTISHPLTFQPSVVVVNSLKEQVFPGTVEYLSASTIRLTFSASLGGEAYLS
jgi:hypothetical protein